MIWSYAIILVVLAIIVIWMRSRSRSCKHGGCGHQVQGNDGNCAVCRLPLD